MQVNEAIQGLETDIIITDSGYLTLEFKAEKEEEEINKDMSCDAEDKTPIPLSTMLLEPEFIKIEPEDEDGGQESLTPVVYKKNLKGIDKFNEFQAKEIQLMHSYALPEQDLFKPNLRSCNSIGLNSVIQDVFKGGQKNKNLFQFHISVCETERLLKRRERDRERKALQRATETEEQGKIRREKARLAKAALRAAEPVEKRLLRRERERIAKAFSRARETDEQRRRRLEKSRVAVAALRASQSEEQKLIRREKDRIKKKMLRQLETEEQKRIRREKNRIAVAIRRALQKQKKNFINFSKDDLVRETKLSRAIEVVEFPLQSIKLECLSKVKDPLAFTEEDVG